MKDFIYLDTDYLTSYLSQINDGQIIKKIVSDFEGNQSQLKEGTETIEKSTEFAGTASGSIPAIASLDATYARSKTRTSPLQITTFSEFEFGQSLISKTVHDNAFEELLNYTQNNDLINNGSVGSYYFGEVPYTLFDLDYYHQLFSNTAIMNLSPNSFKTDQEVSIENLIASQKQVIAGTSDKTKKNETRKKLQELEHQLQNSSVAATIEAVKAFCPTSCFLANANLLIPLRSNFLRDGYKESIFKYSGQVHLFGKITRQVVSQKESSIKDIEAINSFFETVMLGIFESFNILQTEDPFVVSPVAIYFE